MQHFISTEWGTYKLQVLYMALIDRIQYNKNMLLLFGNVCCFLKLTAYIDKVAD